MVQNNSDGAAFINRCIVGNIKKYGTNKLTIYIMHSATSINQSIAQTNLTAAMMMIDRG
jgi:hypothetical protein